MNNLADMKKANCEYDFLYNSKVQMFVFDNTTSAVSFAIINAMSGVNWANPQPEQFKEVSGYIFDNYCSGFRIYNLNNDYVSF